jgi:putative tricarboxylic transport membrane protein
MPKVPTLKEQGIETTPFQMWRGVAMPKGAPADAVAYWQGVLKKVAATKQFKDYISSNVATLHVIAGPEFERFLGEQEAVYKDMLTRLGQMPK